MRLEQLPPIESSFYCPIFKHFLKQGIAGAASATGAGYSRNSVYIIDTAIDQLVDFCSGCTATIANYLV